MLQSAKHKRLRAALKARSLALLELERCQAVLEVAILQRSLPPVEATPLEGITKIDNGAYAFMCPHCTGAVIVPPNMVNCKIFRHGIYKSSCLPINPHASKAECDRLFREGLIEGCGKPFRFTGDEVSICQYV
jgi:hypothetical protein